MQMETLTSETGEMDRISQLPESIIHHILSLFLYPDHYYLNSAAPRALVRMSVLSKHWLDITSSFPILIFDTYSFKSNYAYGFTSKRGTSEKEFYKYVDYTTSRFFQHNVPAQTLILITRIKNAAELKTVNRCLDLVSKKGVMDLVIRIDETPKPMSKYPLANTLICFSMLKSLDIRSCELPSSLMAGVFKFESLIFLCLDRVYINDEAIKYLTTSCPLLQELAIGSCHGFKSFCLYGHQHLQRINLCHLQVERIHIDAPNLFDLKLHMDDRGGLQVERIHIDAPNLSDLTIHMDDRGGGPPLMNLASCKKLTTLSYSGNPLPNSNGFTNFLSNFPFVEKLVFEPYSCNNLKLSSHSLRILDLHTNCNLEDIELSTPNLVLFSYPSWSCNPIEMNERWLLSRDSTHFRAHMHFYPPKLDTIWFKKLRLFFDKENGFKPTDLYISTTIDSQGCIDLEDLKEIEFPPYELEHVEVQLDANILKRQSLAYKSFVDVVLWCCRPQSLTLRSTLRSPFPSRYFRKVVKFTYEKLLQQEDQGHTKIQIVWPSSESQKHFDDSKSLSTLLPLETKTISFIKKQVNQEEAESQRNADMEIFRRNGFRVSSRKKVMTVFGKK